MGNSGGTLIAGLLRCKSWHRQRTTKGRKHVQKCACGVRVFLSKRLSWRGGLKVADDIEQRQHNGTYLGSDMCSGSTARGLGRLSNGGSVAARPINCARPKMALVCMTMRAHTCEDFHPPPRRGHDPDGILPYSRLMAQHAPQPGRD